MTLYIRGREKGRATDGSDMRNWALSFLDVGQDVYGKRMEGGMKQRGRKERRKCFYLVLS